MAYNVNFDEGDSRDEFDMTIMGAMMKSTVGKISEAVGSIVALWRPIRYHVRRIAQSACMSVVHYEIFTKAFRKRFMHGVLKAILR